MKTDRVLGLAVNEHLKEIGINTPTVPEMLAVEKEVKIGQIEKHMTEILSILGLDLTDDSLCETPRRVAEMYVNEIFSGLLPENFPKCTTVENKFSGTDDFVLEKNITLYSDCEHHIRPIVGVVHVAYIPGDKVLGLSKLHRVCQYFGQRPQVQERLTQQIAEAIAFVTGSEDVVVMVDAKHLCVSQRGIRDVTSSTATMTAKGRFKVDSQLRSEFVRNVTSS